MECQGLARYILNVLVCKRKAVSLIEVCIAKLFHCDFQAQTDVTHHLSLFFPHFLAHKFQCSRMWCVTMIYPLLHKGPPTDAPAVDTAEQVYISSLALLKVIK